VRGIANPPLLTSDSEGSTLLPSASYRDLMVLKGGGRGPTKLGVVPLSDGAGAVAAIGEGVTRVKIGDRSAGCFHPRWFGGPLSADYLTDPTTVRSSSHRNRKRISLLRTPGQ
jgi:hypothetical protein